MGRVPSILESKISICWDLKFFFDFYMKDVLRYFVLKVVIPHYFWYMYATNAVKVLVQDLRQVMYVVPRSKNTLSSMVYMRVVTRKL